VARSNRSAATPVGQNPSSEAGLPVIGDSIAETKWNSVQESRRLS
jgi:hypothetical protein